VGCRLYRQSLGGESAIGVLNDRAPSEERQQQRDGVLKHDRRIGRPCTRSLFSRHEIHCLQVQVVSGSIGLLDSASEPAGQVELGKEVWGEAEVQILTYTRAPATSSIRDCVISTRIIRKYATDRRQRH
jgi:hypothetical protein